MITRAYQITALIICIFFSSSCSFLSHKSFKNLASKKGFHYLEIDTGQFTLATYFKGVSLKEELNVYIEGDGRAFNGYGKITSNPTPREPIALKLALQDPHTNVLYIARPYQYIEAVEKADEINKYWSSHRFSREVVDSINFTIDKYFQKYNFSQVRLIGFSGGAAIAVLVSARRKDVKKIVTIAGNLNPDLHSSIHNVKALKGSLNPIDHISEIENIEQLHYIGENDNIVPEVIIQDFVNRFKSGDKVEVIRCKNTTHTRGWEKCFIY